MTTRLLLVSLVSYLAGALSLAGAALIGMRLRGGAARPSDEATEAAVSGELLAQLLRSVRSPMGRRRASRPISRRSTGAPLVR